MIKPKEDELIVMIQRGITVIGKVKKVYVDGSIVLTDVGSVVGIDADGKYLVSVYHPAAVSQEFTFGPNAYDTFFEPNKAIIEDYADYLEKFASGLFSVSRERETELTGKTLN